MMFSLHFSLHLSPQQQSLPLFRKPPMAPLPSRAFCPCAPSAWLPTPQMLRVRHSPFLARSLLPPQALGRPFYILLLSQCLAEGQAQSRY